VRNERPRSSSSRVDQFRVKFVLIQATSHIHASAIVEELMACHRGGVVGTVVQLWPLWLDMTLDLRLWFRKTWVVFRLEV
jgi:hypothetical protein